MPNLNDSSQLSQLTEQEQYEKYEQLHELFCEMIGETYESEETIVQREAEILSLLNEGVKPYNPAVENRGISCLVAAMIFISSEEKAIQWIEILLQYGADINVLHGNKTLLHVAIEDNRLKIAEYLIDKHHLDVNAKTSLYYTPLHMAASHPSNALELVKFLLSKGADPNIENCCEEKAEDKTDDPEVIKLLREAEKINLGNLKKSKLNFHHQLTEQEQYEGYGQLRKLFSERLYECYNFEDIDQKEAEILYLLNSGVKPHNPRWNIEHLESSFLIDIVSFLNLEKDATQWIKILVQHGADIHNLNSDTTLLHAAACKNFLQLAKYLIDEQHLDVNAPSLFFYTPLHESAKYSRNPLETVKFLLEKGADPRIKNAFEKKAIDEAEDPEVIKLLREAEEKITQQAIEIENQNNQPKAELSLSNCQTVSSENNYKNPFLKFLSIFKNLKISSAQNKIQGKDVPYIKLKCD